MKKLIITSLIILTLCSCGTSRQSTTTTIKEIITKRDTIVLASLPKEVVKTITLIDTVFKPIEVETSVAKAKVSIEDGKLNVELQNKDSIEVKVEYIEKEVYKNKEIITYKYETPKWAWKTMFALLVLILLLVFKDKIVHIWKRN